MKNLVAFCLFLFLSLTAMAGAQDTVAVGLDECVAQLAARCPIVYGDSWEIDTIVLTDSCARVEMNVPANLAMFFPVLTENKANVKRMWVRQFQYFGDPWKRFVKLMLKDGRPIMVCLRPGKDNPSATLMFYPGDFETE